jgi:hypothetical protein
MGMWGIKTRLLALIVKFVEKVLAVREGNPSPKS